MFCHQAQITYWVAPTGVCGGNISSSYWGVGSSDWLICPGAHGSVREQGGGVEASLSPTPIELGT